MTPKSEKIGKICTFFFIHPSFCVVNFAKKGISHKALNRSVSKPHPQKSPPITQNPLRTKWGGENKRTSLF